MLIMKLDNIKDHLTTKFKKLPKNNNKKYINDKNQIDWVDISNKVKRYQAFQIVSEAESSKAINEAIFYTTKDKLSTQPRHISPLTLKDNIKQWKKLNKYQEKLHLQDLLYFNILDFVTDDQTNGTHQVLKSHYEDEKNRYLIKH
ncbi:unnamed protein product [Cunninghamella echinulata]